MLHQLELKIPPILLGLLCATAMKIISLVLPSFAYALAFSQILAWLVFIIAGGILCISLYTFKTAKTTVNPIDPALASSLQIHGIYHITRNPMYLAFLLMLVSYAILLCNWFVWLLPVFFAIWITRLQIIPEERILAQKFGKDYETYKQRVRRWI